MSLADELYSALTKTHMLLDDSDLSLLQQFGLSNTRYHTLMHLHKHPGLSQNELSEKLLCTKGNTTRIVKSMEENGYITRQVDPEDNRALRLYLTPAGEELRKRADKAYQDLNERRFSCLCDLEQGGLHENLDALNEHLESLVQEQKAQADA
jgi:DNA-binding MarR family transcriptional regulator